MRHLQRLISILIIMSLPAIGWTAPGVKHKTKTTVKFHGFLGTMMKLAGAGKPKFDVVYVQGNQQCSEEVDKKGRPTSSAIVDLDREVFINVDHERKEYTITTFDEWREMMEQFAQKLSGKGQTAEIPDSSKIDRERPEMELTFDFSVDRPGDKKKIAGYQAEKVVMTLKATGEQQATEESTGGKGGMIITSNQWLTQEPEGHEELTAFGLKLVEKLGMAMPTQASVQSTMSTVMEQYPQLAKALERLKEESQKLDGFAVLSESVFETWSEVPQTAATQQTEEPQEVPTSIGGALGAFGKKFTKQKPKEDDGRSVLFESTIETEEFGRQSIDPAVFKEPTEYKQVKRKNPLLEDQN